MENATIFQGYKLLSGVYDEIFSSASRSHAKLRNIVDYFGSFSAEKFQTLHNRAQEILTERGVTFNFYGADNQQIEKIFPFDLLPRVITHQEWQIIEAGLKQRITALNLFLNDVYTNQLILRDKKIPPALVLSSPGYIKKMQGIIPRQNNYIHVAGIDIIRNNKGELVVLEDNLRVPSGISYVIENRQMMKRLFPDIFAKLAISPVENYPIQLRESLISHTEHSPEECLMVVLTPGPYNSAYFEHSFLSCYMGCPIVEAPDLFVENDKVYLNSIDGPKQVHIIYRRIDDEYLDPTVLNPDSLLGVPGLVQAYAKGNVVIANAIGNGVADDKSIYPYVHDMIRYYLAEEPILKQVTTYSCSEPAQCELVLKHLESFVVKLINQSGGYGIFIGPQASQQQIIDMKSMIKHNPRNYVAQPLEELSTCPTFENGWLSPKRVDFRPYIVTDKTSWVLPGGLTRVALRENSYIVNSSQGGGSKDTWVMTE